MADLAGLWPEVNNSRPANKVLLTIVLATSAGFPDPLGEEVRQGIRELDDLLGRDSELSRSVDARLLASQPHMLLSNLQRIMLQAASETQLDAESVLNVSIQDVLDQSYSSSENPASHSKSVAQWLIILTDARESEKNEWVARLEAKIRAESLTVIPVILSGGDARVLSSAMGPHKPPLLLKRGGASPLFTWLGSELRRTVKAKAGQRVSLNVAGMAAWADLDTDAATY